MKEKIEKLKSIKILFVEDEEILREIIDGTLSKLQINFEVADNGKTAFEKFIERDFDLIVTDINMPQMDGFEFIKKVKEVNNNIPIIIMTAHTEPEYIKKAKEMDIGEYLVKPFDFIKFINLVGEVK